MKENLYSTLLHNSIVSKYAKYRPNCYIDIIKDIIKEASITIKDRQQCSFPNRNVY